MSRLVTFGCSFTYGQGLPGCKIGNNTTKVASTPSEYAWPVNLSKLLDIKVINKGVPGASNLEILFHILNFDFKQDDIVVIMWSFPDRDLYFNSVKGLKPFKQLGNWLLNRNKYEEEWLKNLSFKDNCVKSWLHIHHADLYLQSLSLKYIHYPTVPNLLKEYQPGYIKKITNFYSDGFADIDKGEDNSHPGIKSHLETAKRIYNILNE
jgi:hypothetical protein